jgi:hypothetical protein
LPEEGHNSKLGDENPIHSDVNHDFILTLKTWSSLRAVGPTGRKLGQDSLLFPPAF